MTVTDASPLRPGHHELRVRGVTLGYHVHGAGPVLVAHPGGPGVFWDYLRMPLVERHMTVVYVEPLGTGGSDRLPSHPHGYTRQLHSKALAALIDHLGQERVHLLGHSHGGFIAQRFAVNHAERLAGVVLYASAAATGVEFNAESVRQLAAFTARNAFNPELPDVLSQLRSIGSLRDDRSLTSALRGLLPAYLADYWGRREEFSTLRRAIRVSYISNLDSRLDPENIDDRMVLPTLTVPTLVVAGRYDIVCGPRWAMELHSLIRDSRVLILEQSGHFGHLEEPGEFTDGVMGFVRSLADLRPSAGVDR